MTIFGAQGSWMYLVAVLDLYARYVVSWTLDFQTAAAVYSGKGVISDRYKYPA